MYFYKILSYKTKKCLFVSCGKKTIVLKQWVERRRRLQIATLFFFFFSYNNKVKKSFFRKNYQGSVCWGSSTVMIWLFVKNFFFFNRFNDLDLHVMSVFA
jgi:hypothetical protein